MKKQTVEIMLIVILGVAFLIILNRYRGAQEAPATIDVKLEEASVLAELPSVEQEETIKYTSSSLRDPMEISKPVSEKFKKVSETVAPRSDFVLKGISLTENKPRAIINSKVVGVGDNINGAKVLKITKEGVMVQTETEELFLKIESH